MGVEGFLGKVRQHWIAGLILCILLLLFIGAGNLYMGILSPDRFMASQGKSSMAYESLDSMGARYGGAYTVPSSQDFAPQVTQRMIEKTATLTSEVDRGDFPEAAGQLKSIISQSSGFILNQNEARYGMSESMTGTYQCKVPAAAYENVVRQLKSIGEVQSFVEQAADITGQYQNTAVELLAEKQRLERYKELYKSYGTLSDRMQLEDRIFNQERRIAYLEQSLTTQGQRVEYATVSVTLREEESGWAKIGWVRLSDLAKTFVGSAKGLLYFFSAILPWLVGIAVVCYLVVLVRRLR